MTDVVELRGGRTPDTNRLPVRVAGDRKSPVAAKPKGEEPVSHAVAGKTASGEASEAGLTNPNPVGVRPPLNSTTNKSKRTRKRVKVEGEICRATCRFRIEPRRLVKDHHRGQCGGPQSCLACYLDAALCEARESVTLASNVAMREAYRRESDWFDAWVLKHGRVPGKGEGAWLAPVKGQLYPYEPIRRVAPTLSSNVAACLSERIVADWKAWRWEVLVKQSRSPAHYRNALIPIPAAAYKLRHVEGDEFAFTFSLHSKEHEHAKRVTVPLTAEDDHQRFLLQGLASGSWKLGQATIQEDKTRKGRWYLRLAYKRVVETVARSERVAAINRGVGCFLAVVTYTGEDWVYPGADIVAHLAQMKARRRSYQNDSKASNRNGRGRRRILRPTDRLDGIATRWRQDKIHVLARRLGDWLSERDICRLYMEDFTAIRHGAHDRLGKHVGQLVQEWPYYQLGQVITSVCQELGIEVVLVPSRDSDGGIAETCVACDHVDSASMQYRFRRFSCTRCGFRRHLDVATAMNVLVRGERLSDGRSAGVARDPKFLRSRAPLRGPSTVEVMKTPGVSEGRDGTARKAGPKDAKHKRF